MAAPASPPQEKPADDINAEQHAYWNGRGGEHWVEEQDFTDRMLAPVAEMLIETVRAGIGTLGGPDRLRGILDVGCGAGATTLMLAQLAPAARVMGVDISEPLLAAARARMPALQSRISFHVEDAARSRFEGQSFDLIISRFGVMFFGAPDHAFANLRAALRPGGEVIFACWRAFAENPWMRVPLEAACKHVPWPPRPHPEDAGPFSFADPERVRRILGHAGFAEPVFEKRDFLLDLAGGAGLEAAASHACRIGAASRAMADQPEALQEAARREIRASLANYARGEAVPLPAAIWLVRARHA